MKKYVVLLALVSSFGAFAQIEKGTKTFGGTGGLSLSQSKSGTDYMSARLKPEFGYFLKKNWMIQSQLNLGYTYIKQGFDLDKNVQGLNTGLSLSTRYYVPINERFMLFGEFGIAMNTSFAKHEDFFWRSVSSRNPIYMNSFATVGASYFLTDNLAIEAGVRYTSGGLNLANGSGVLSVPIGIKYYFGRGKKK
ncbi:MAG: outer membrane beta-barrel protein [Salibacteraceae bacterium]|nr:outer membrane beta-barrel protein [Salibacteraceae bacterium]MDP4763703.1 outer membrane beta-barrel protein [Salibacteraceae bacterium]MDP4934905.1 outer membrane beta-barrel protein [Salibacteraceae bacterium]